MVDDEPRRAPARAKRIALGVGEADDGAQPLELLALDLVDNIGNAGLPIGSPGHTGRQVRDALLRLSAEQLVELAVDDFEQIAELGRDGLISRQSPHQHLLEIVGPFLAVAESDGAG